VLVVDDHPIVRHGLAELIDHEPDLQICGQAGSAGEVPQMIGEAAPDAMLIDISLEDVNGIDLTKTIRQSHPAIPILVLSMHDEALYAERALRAGANGYIMKGEAPEMLLKALRRVLDGGLYVSDRIAAHLIRGLFDRTPTSKTRYGVESLSDRELETFEMVGRGLATREIAARLNRSIKTIETHRSRIKQKLGLRNASELVQHAVNWVTSADSPLRNDSPASAARPPETKAGGKRAPSRRPRKA
jgi:DNA-binding NarL/FixJ family response regulator